MPGDGTRGPGIDTATSSGSSPVTAITLDIGPNLAALKFNGAGRYGRRPRRVDDAAGTTGLGTSTITVGNGAQTIARAVQISGGSLVVLVSNRGTLANTGNVSDDDGEESLTLNGDGRGKLGLSGSNTSAARRRSARATGSQRLAARFGRERQRRHARR